MKAMTDEQILSEMRRIMEETLCLEDPGAITVESRFVEDLQVDSLDMLSILVEIQVKYEVEIPSEEVLKLTTVGETVAYIRQKIDAGSIQVCAEET